ncbi:hypothetical protein ABEF95_010779 [Exophiala dermatitidis]
MISANVEWANRCHDLESKSCRCTLRGHSEQVGGKWHLPSGRFLHPEPTGKTIRFQLECSPDVWHFENTSLEHPGVTWRYLWHGCARLALRVLSFKRSTWDLNRGCYDSKGRENNWVLTMTSHMQTGMTCLLLMQFLPQEDICPAVKATLCLVNVDF